MSKLFEPFVQRGITLRNRIAVSPMCQYSATDGVPGDWHLVHLGSRAVGGAGAVFCEATAVSAEGRISPGDTGIWNDRQARAWAPIAAFIAAQGAVAGMQLAHAGRKASTDAPWRGGKALAPAQGGWTPVAPSARRFSADSPQPLELDAEGIAGVIADFAAAAGRARDAGFGLLEVHAAHGYLLHEFLSPLANTREGRYGGCFDNRIRLLCEVLGAIRGIWPERLPLWLRISATDWAPADGARGWDIEQSIELARVVAPLGVDLIDVSSGGLLPDVQVPIGPGYQVPFAARIRREASIATGAVGLITEPGQAERIVADGEADIVLLAREMLRDPYFPLHAARRLGASIEPPDQYRRAW